jgi:cystathionine beta-lyase/cystathionine gamma-synthase
VTANPWTGRLFRVHAGLEDVGDLIADLARGFAALRA